MTGVKGEQGKRVKGEEEIFRILFFFLPIPLLPCSPVSPSYH